MARDGIKCSDCGRDLRAFQVIRIKGAPFCTTCFRAQVALALNAHALVEEAVSQGLAYGWRRLFKHREKPAGLPHDLTVVDELTQHVMNELSGVVNWDRSAGVVTTADAVNDHKR